MRRFRSITSSTDGNLYVGPYGEIVVDNDLVLRIQDNVTPGGVTISVAGPTGPAGTPGENGPTGAQGPTGPEGTGGGVANTGNISFDNTTILGNTNSISNNYSITLRPSLDNPEVLSIRSDGLGNLFVDTDGVNSNVQIGRNEFSHVFIGSNLEGTGNIDLITIGQAPINISAKDVVANIGNIKVGNNWFGGRALGTFDPNLYLIANTHSFIFSDLSNGLTSNVGIGARLDFDDGPFLQTWYGNFDTPWDPPEQKSLDVVAANSNSYVELSSSNWDNYIGVKDTYAFIETNWNADPYQKWIFSINGEVILPAAGVISSVGATSNIVLQNGTLSVSTRSVDNVTSYTSTFDNNGNLVMGGSILPSSNVTHSLGSAEFQWKDLWVSSNTIYIGSVPLSIDNGELTINGNAVVGSGLPTVNLPAVPPTTYKGLQVAYGVIYGNSNPSEYNVNKIVIHKPTNATVTIDPNGSNDDFQVSGIASSDVLAMFVIYGDVNGAKPLSDLQAFAEAAIDNVILSGGIEGVFNTVDDMKAAFYANYATLAAAANGLYTNFQFFAYNTTFTVNSSNLLVGTGAVFEFVGDGLSYAVTPTTPGTNYTQGLVIRISGTAFGQPDSRWDVDLTVTGVDGSGGVTSATAVTVLGEGWYLTGTFPGIAGDLTPGQGLIIYTLNYDLGNDTVSVGNWDNGTGYQAGNIVKILGTDILDANSNPLSSPANDVTVTISQVNQFGQITQLTASGTVPRPTGVWPNNSINDGGADQYDDGNYINTNLASEILYNAGNTVVDGTAAFGAGSSYSFVYDTAIFGLFATGSSATSISTSGNSGADGNSTTEAGNIYDPGTPQQTLTSAATHINLYGTPYLNTVTFTKTDGGSEIDILIPDDGNGAGVGITRDSNNGIFNPYREGSWDSDVSPGGTVWNIDGWDDLTDVESRLYAPLYETFGFGGLGNKIVGAECVMYLPDNGKYYTVQFSSWTQGGNGGGFAYTRKELDLSNLEQGIRFQDGTKLTSAEGVGRVKSTASNGRRIEEVAGNKTVTVTARTTAPAVSATIYDTRTDYYIYINWDQDLYNLYNGATPYGLEFSQDNATWYPATVVGASSNTYLQLYMVGNRTISVTQGETVYYRVSTGGDPVVWWDKNDLPSGGSNFRGAVIDYHAFTGDSTIIGTIHIVDDDGEENITHTEVSSGSTDGENDDLWIVQNEGTISYRRIDGEVSTIKVHWIAKVFYGSEIYD